MRRLRLTARGRWVVEGSCLAGALVVLGLATSWAMSVGAAA